MGLLLPRVFLSGGQEWLAARGRCRYASGRAARRGQGPDGPPSCCALPSYFVHRRPAGNASPQWLGVAEADVAAADGSAAAEHAHGDGVAAQDRADVQQAELARLGDAETSATVGQGFPAREQFGVLEFEVLHRHGRKSGHGASFGSDLPRTGRSASPASAGARVSGTRPTPRWRRARTRCTLFGTHIVRSPPYSTLYPGVGQGLRTATKAHRAGDG